MNFALFILKFIKFKPVIKFEKFELHGCLSERVSIGWSRLRGKFMPKMRQYVWRPGAELMRSPDPLAAMGDLLLRGGRGRTYKGDRRRVGTDGWMDGVEFNAPLDTV